MRRTAWLAAAVLALAIAPAAHAHPLPEHGQLTFTLTDPLAAPLGIGENVSCVGGDNGSPAATADVLPVGGRRRAGPADLRPRPLLGKRPAAPRNLFRGDPVKLWEASPYRDGRPVGAPFTHTHDITVYPDHPVEGLGARDIALLAEGGNDAGDGDTGSVFVIDVTDPTAPVVLNRWLHGRGGGHLRSATTTRPSCSTATRASCS